MGCSGALRMLGGFWVSHGGRRVPKEVMWVSKGALGSLRGDLGLHKEYWGLQRGEWGSQGSGGGSQRNTRVLRDAMLIPRRSSRVTDRVAGKPYGLLGSPHRHIGVPQEILRSPGKFRERYGALPSWGLRGVRR